MSFVTIRDPISHTFTNSINQCLASCGNRHNNGPIFFHRLNVWSLSLYIFCTHKYFTLESRWGVTPLDNRHWERERDEMLRNLEVTILHSIPLNSLALDDVELDGYSALRQQHNDYDTMLNTMSDEYEQYPFEDAEENPWESMKIIDERLSDKQEYYNYLYNRKRRRA